MNGLDEFLLGDVEFRTVDFSNGVTFTDSGSSEVSVESVKPATHAGGGGDNGAFVVVDFAKQLYVYLCWGAKHWANA